MLLFCVYKSACCVRVCAIFRQFMNECVLEMLPNNKLIRPKKKQTIITFSQNIFIFASPSFQHGKLLGSNGYQCNQSISLCMWCNYVSRLFNFTTAMAEETIGQKDKGEFCHFVLIKHLTSIHSLCIRVIFDCTIINVFLNCFLFYMVKLYEFQ